MRYILICLLPLLVWGRAQSQPHDIVERARRSVSAALPELNVAPSPALAELEQVESTALGCPLVAGLPLSSPIAAWRLEFTLAGEPFRGLRLG